MIVYSFLDNNKILTDKQYGFRERHSTYMAILNLIDKITEEIDNKKIVVGRKNGKRYAIESKLVLFTGRKLGTGFDWYQNL